MIHLQGKLAVKRSRAQLMRKPSDVKTQLEEMMTGGKSHAAMMMNRNSVGGRKGKFIMFIIFLHYVSMITVSIVIVF